MKRLFLAAILVASGAAIGAANSILGNEKSLDAKMDALVRLEALRTIPAIAVEDAARLAGLIHKDAAAGRFSLKSIGTNEDEIASLINLSWRREAEFWVQNMRDPSVLPVEREVNTKHIHEAMEHGNFSAADMGTTEKEINNVEGPLSSEELETRKAGTCRIMAKFWLAELRKKPNKTTATELGFIIREEAVEGHFSLADVGTAEAELPKEPHESLADKMKAFGGQLPLFLNPFGPLGVPGIPGSVAPPWGPPPMPKNPIEDPWIHPERQLKRT